ncbi:MAG: hypothetical protein ACM3NW_09045 [Syntrophomonadaceae bacterium]
MPRTPNDDRKPDPKQDAPQTDLPPRKEPYYEGYFGTEEEESVVREEDDSAGRPRQASEDTAGGDREILI